MVVVVTMDVMLVTGGDKDGAGSVHVRRESHQQRAETEVDRHASYGYCWQGQTRS